MSPDSAHSIADLAVDLLDETTELVCAAGPGGRIVYVNRAWQRALGYSLAEASAMTPVDLVAPEQRAWYLDVARRLVRGEPVEDFEAVLVAKDGRRVVCRGRAIARMENGRCVGTVAVYRDVTAERHAGTLRSRLASTLEATSDFVGIVTRDGQVVYLNRAWRRLLGLRDDADLAAVRVHDLFPPVGLQRWLVEAAPVALREGRWEGEARAVTAKGQSIPVSLVVVAHPSLRANEPPFFYSAVMRDLRDRVRAGEALRESERRYRGVLEHLRAVAVTVDAAGRVTFANDHLLALTGWTREEVLGADWFARFDARGAEARQRFLDGVARDEVAPTNESEIVLRAGGTRVIVWDNVAVRDAAGRLAGVAAVGRDVTEERRVRDMKDQLIATVSHELRSPLGAVRGALQVLAKQPALQEGQPRALVDMALRNADRLVRLTNDLLDVERLESGTTPMHAVPVSSRSLIRSALETMRHAADEAGVSLEDASPAADTAPSVRADVDRVHQVLVNLIGNAIKFSPRGSAVTVDAACDGAEVRFRVCDRGRGIPADKLATIFDRFAQVHAADAREQQGAGLGLAISRAIVRQHGGRIWAESVEGAGSAFIFTLPAA